MDVKKKNIFWKAFGLTGQYLRKNFHFLRIAFDEQRDS